MQLSEEFLATIGLGDLPEQGRRKLLSKVSLQLETSVGIALSEGLSDEQLDEFGAFVNHDEARTIDWLDATSPGWQGRLNQGDAQLYDHASMLWLAMHRPDYREVIADTLADIKLDLLENRDAIRDCFSDTPRSAS